MPAESTRRRARHLVEAYYRRHRARLAQVPEELFRTLLLALIPDAADEPAAYAGAGQLITALGAIAARERDKEREAAQEAERKRIVLVRVGAALATLAFRAQAGEGPDTLRAEVDEVRREFESLSARASQGAEVSSAPDRAPLKALLAEVIDERTGKLVETARRCGAEGRDDHVTQAELEQIDVTYGGKLKELIDRL